MREPHKKRTRTDGEPSSHPVFVEVDPATFEVMDAANGPAGGPLARGLFAIGAARGDNFVRFLLGDALGVRRRLLAQDGQ